MNKRKVNLITVTFDNGETDTFDCDATFSESINSRKKYGFSNLQEWVEYHITWVTYVQDLPTVEPSKSPEEIEAEMIIRSKEKMKDPMYAGTQDGKDFYKQPDPPDWLLEWEIDFKEGFGNGSR